MASGNFTQRAITQQLAQRSGQVALTQRDGGYQFVDELTGRTLSGPPVDSSLLAMPQSVNDPRLTARSVELARGFFEGQNVPQELVEAIASVASYISATRGIPVTDLITPQGLSDDLIRAYNSFKPKGSQVGRIAVNSLPSWTNTPTLRGSIKAALVDV